MLDLVGFFLREVGSVILGIKNREELVECLDAEKKGKLNEEQMKALNKLF